MQHAVDLHGGDGRALQRGEQHAAQRVAERQAEAALERLGDDGREARAVAAGSDLELVRLDQILPVLLEHLSCLSCSVERWRLAQPLRESACNMMRRECLRR